MPSFSGASQPLKDARSPWYCLANVQEPPTLCKCFTLHLSPPSYPFQADLVPYNRAPATATPNAPSIPVPTTGAPPTAALLVWDGAPPDDVDGVDFLLVAVPVLSAAADPAVVALAPDAGFAFAAPAVTTTGKYPFAASLPVNVVVVTILFTPCECNATSVTEAAAAIAEVSAEAEAEAVHSAYVVPERAQLMDLKAIDSTPME